MEIKTCRFVDASDLFQGCPDAWQAFMDADPPVSWGDANRTMVSVQLMEFALIDMVSDDENIEKQIDKVHNRLQQIGGVYIDLEN